MYSSPSLKILRALQTLKIEGVKRLNLVAGRNNSGTSSVWEALNEIEHGALNPGRRTEGKDADGGS